MKTLFGELKMTEAEQQLWCVIYRDALLEDDASLEVANHRACSAVQDFRAAMQHLARATDLEEESARAVPF